MIRLIKGKVIEKKPNSIIIDTGQIGYKISISLKSAGETSLGQEIVLHTHLAVRENAMDLYGFTTTEELNFFELLLTLNGVGPKTALTILSTSNSETIVSGIQSNDANYLSKISGLGKKTAEKLLLGLKDKIGVIENNTDTNTNGSVVIDALVSLGYSEKNAREIILKIKSNTTENMIREALQLLNKK
jgi:holliday junction DNA helicase RuvA